jgi:glutamate racemase
MLPVARVHGKPCPLLVPLVEEGWLDSEITKLTLKEYLQDLFRENVDTIILGCTHYPLLEETIQEIAGPEVALIDSGRETARVVSRVLNGLQLANKGKKTDENRFYVSDIPLKFEEIGSRFLGQNLTNVERVDFDEFLIRSGKPDVSVEFHDKIKASTG